MDSVWGTGKRAQWRWLDPVTGRVDSVRFAGADSLKTRFSYDLRTRRVAKVTDPRKHETVYEYDAVFGNSWRTTLPGNRTTERVYDGFGRDTASRENDLPWRIVRYDSLNQVTEQRDSATGPPTRFYYDGPHQNRVVDARGLVHKDDYNSLGLVTRRYDAADTTRFASYRLDAAGRLTSWTNRRLQQIDISYDSLDRIRSRTGGNTPVDSFAYSFDGRVSALWNSIERDSIFRDYDRRVDSVVTRFGGRRFRINYSRHALRPSAPSSDTWTDKGRMDSTTIASDAGINFAGQGYTRYPDNGLLKGITVGGAGPYFEYDGDDQLVRVVWQQSGVERRYSYTATHQPFETSFRNAANLEAAFGRSYSFDRRLSMETERRSSGSTTLRRTFSYDAPGHLSRVVEEQEGCVRQTTAMSGTGTAIDSTRGWVYTCTSAPVADKSYGYDAVGNRTEPGATYPAGNRIQTWPAFRFEHDNDGNITRKYTDGTIGPSDAHYEWSASGLLTRVTNAALDMRYDYNAVGQLVRRTRNGVVDRFFLWEGDHMIAELQATNGAPTRRIAQYAYYPGINEPFAIATDSGVASSKVRFFEQDVQRNVIGVFAGATIAQQTLYGPWGQIVALPVNTLADTNRLWWNGQLYEGDSTRLYYMRNRWYDPQTGRFMSEDLLGIDGGINVYAYANGDPIQYSDPYGLEGCQLGLHASWFCWNGKTPAELRTGSLLVFEAWLKGGTVAASIRAGVVGAINDDANAVSIGQFGKNTQHNDVGDAFKHAYGSCKLTQSFGREIAKKIGDAHEDREDNPPGDKAMDLHNNAIGRILGENPLADCKDTVLAAIQNGQLQVTP